MNISDLIRPIVPGTDPLRHTDRRTGPLLLRRCRPRTLDAGGMPLPEGRTPEASPGFEADAAGARFAPQAGVPRVRRDAGREGR